MAIPTVPRPTGQGAANKNAQGTPPVFRPIPLSSSPNLSGSEGKATVVLSGRELDAIIDETFSVYEKYNLRRTQHQSVAGMTSDGYLLYAINSRVGARDYTAMGAFDPTGKPVEPTSSQRKLLGNYISNPGKLITMDAKSNSVIGLKTNGINPNVSVYTDLASKNTTFYFDTSFDTASLKADGSVTLDKRMNLAKRALNVSGGGNGFTGKASYEKAGDVVNASLDAAYRPGDTGWGVQGLVQKNGDVLKRQLGADYKSTDRQWALDGSVSRTGDVSGHSIGANYKPTGSNWSGSGRHTRNGDARSTEIGVAYERPKNLKVEVAAKRNSGASGKADHQIEIKITAEF